ncbi:MAG: hypothetical protein ACYTF6_07960 [Planctomycetota bacterium]|jgi:hypothetical protein
MIASEYTSFSLRIATVVVPIGVYFLILGLLNSRRHPQLLSGRQDFALLIAALSPLLVMPVLDYVGATVWTLAGGVACVAGLILLLGPRGRTWVIYNLSQAQARNAIGQALREIDIDFVESKGGFELRQGGCFVEIGGFAPLRNVSVRLRGGDKQTSYRFERALSSALTAIKAETNPAGVSLLVVATGMLVAPFTLIAGEVPEIVRMLTDLF